MINSDASPATSSTATYAPSGSDYAEDFLVIDLQEVDDNVSEVPLPTPIVLKSIELFNHLKELANKDSWTKEQKLQIVTLLPTSWSTFDVM